MRMFRNIRSVFPSVPVALFYHGGDVPLSDPITDAADVLAVPHVIFTGSEFALRELIARGAPAERIRISPVGFRLQDFTPDAGRSYLPDGLLRCLTVGRLSAEKGHAVMLAALARLPGDLRARVRWRVIGSGPEERALRDRMQELDLSSQVAFLGALPRPAVIAELKHTDCLVLPSVPTTQWAETQACVLQEAMLMAVPVLAARLGGVSESTAPGCRELLFAPGDAAALAQRLALLLGGDGERLAALGNEGRVWARANFDVRTRTADLVSEALGAC